MITARDSRDDAETRRLYDELYERYGKSLEGQHRGSFVAISRGGETLLASTLLEVAQEATAKLGRGHFVYKVGERAVGKWR